MISCRARRGDPRTFCSLARGTCAGRECFAPDNAASSTRDDRTLAGQWRTHSVPRRTSFSAAAIVAIGSTSASGSSKSRNGAEAPVPPCSRLVLASMASATPLTAAATASAHWRNRLAAFAGIRGGSAPQRSFAPLRRPTRHRPAAERNCATAHWGRNSRWCFLPVSGGSRPGQKITGLCRGAGSKASGALDISPLSLLWRPASGLSQPECSTKLRLRCVPAGVTFMPPCLTTPSRTTSNP